MDEGAAIPRSVCCGAMPGGGGGAVDGRPDPPFLLKPSKTSRSDPFSSVAISRVSYTVLKLTV
jgi:hypothetical protein